MEVVLKKVDDLVPYYQNPRIISDRAIKECAKSITPHGIRQVISIDKNNIIVAGHTRLLACKSLGINEVPCVVYEDSQEKIDAYRLADNKVGELTQWEDNFLLEHVVSMQYNRCIVHPGRLYHGAYHIDNSFKDFPRISQITFIPSEFPTSLKKEHD